MLKHEGGYVNDQNDRGGETYQGVARAFNPSWAGWPVLDQIVNKTWNAIYPGLAHHVEAFYKAQYWNRFKLECIQNQAIANIVFDWLVNSGQAGRQIQKVLVDMGQNVAVDNIIGRNTVAAMNSVNSSILINNIVAARTEYYRAGVEQGWLDSKFINGLVARAESFATEVSDNVGKPQRSTARG